MATKTEERRTDNADLAKKVLAETLFAAAGVGELAVTELRKLPERARGVDRDAVRDQVLRTVGDYQVKAHDAYGELVKRGREVVTTIRDQKSTQQLEQRVVETTQTAVAALTGARAKVSKPAAVEAKADATVETKPAATKQTAAKTTPTPAEAKPAKTPSKQAAATTNAKKAGVTPAK